MKKPDSALFQLVKGLSMAERRYFKIFSTRHYPKDNQYYRLFQAISEQEVYDEESLTKRFAKGRSVSYFAVLKKQLFDTLLEALHHFETYDDPVQQVVRGVHYCAILLHRGLFDACARSVRKYKSDAYALEQYEQVIALIAIEKKLAARKQFEDFDQQAIAALADEEQHCLQFIQLNGAYWKLSAAIYKRHYAKEIGPGKANDILSQLIVTPMFNNSQHALPFLAQLDQLQINALHAFVSRDATQAFQYNRAFLDLMDTNPHLRNAYTDRYFATLNNYLIDCVILQRDNDLLNGIDLLRSLPSDKTFKYIPNIHTQVYRTSNLLLLNYYLGKEDFTSAYATVQEMRKDWKKHLPRLAQPHVVTLLYLCAYTEFCNKQTDASLDSLHQLFEVRNAEDISDLYSSARVLQILAHYEKGNILLIDSLITAFNRSGTTKAQKAETYQVIFKFIKRSLRQPDKSIKSQLQKQLHHLSNEPQEKRVFNNFNFLFWAETITRMR